MRTRKLTTNQNKGVSQMCRECVTPCKTSLDQFAKNQEVLVRARDIGVWFGVLHEKSGREVILHQARHIRSRLYIEPLHLPWIVKHGIQRTHCDISPIADAIWLEAIEIMPISGDAAESIRTAPDQPEQDYRQGHVCAKAE